MLRRKMLVFLASIVGLLVGVGVLAIWLLQGVLGDLDHTGRQDASVVAAAHQMGETITHVEIGLREIQLDREKHLDGLIAAVDQLNREVAAFGETFERPLPEGKPAYLRVVGNLARFRESIGMLATSPDAALARRHTDEALTASIALRQDILSLGKMMRQHVAHEQEAAVAWFRWLVLGLAIVFLIVINISVMVLLRMAHMVLKPVDRLVEASRRLAHEDFDARVAADARTGGEFGELAAAFNHLAEQLQANERKKVETLAQAAVMLNHELNNASAIIKLQLQLLERQSHGSPTFERCLRQISESVSRMTATVEALKRVRRIVLTEYMAGTQMLDLQKSVEEEPAHT